MASRPDVVYAAHDFEAENADELSFKAGERIIVIERDDLYQDGWWQGENIRGERGLFPQTYTKATADEHVVAATATEPTTADQAHHESAQHGSTDMRATIDEVQSHLDGMTSGGSNGHAYQAPPAIPAASAEASTGAPPVDTPMSDDISIHSRSTHDETTSSHAGHEGTGNAKDNLMRNVQLAKDKEERKRQAEEQYREAERARMANEAPPIAGLVLTDESDNEDDNAVDDDSEDEIFPSRGPQYTSSAAMPPVTAATPTMAAVDSTPQPAASERFSGLGASTALPDGVPTSATSSRVVSMSPSAAVPQPASLQTVTETPSSQAQDTPVPHAGHFRSASSSMYRPTPPLQAGPDADRQITSLVSSPLQSHMQQESSSEQEVLVHDRSPIIINDNLALSDSPEDAVNPEASSLARSPNLSSSQTPVASFAPAALPLTNTHHGHSPSYPSAESSSSRPASALGSAFTPATTSGFQQSPRSAIFAKMRGASSDPREWSVEQVVEWGQSKGFDPSILSKFREHEISGDVLVDMDMNSLKEIDILTFGPRAKIAKGIKELRASYEPASVLSPTESNDSGSINRGSHHGSNKGERYAPEAIPENEALSTDFRGLGLQQSGYSPNASTMGRSPSTATATVQPASNDATEEIRDDRLPSASTSLDMPRQRSSLGSAVSGAFGFHGKQKSVSSTSGVEREPEKEGAARSSKGIFSGPLGRTRKPPPTYNSVSDVPVTEKPAPQPQRQSVIQPSPSSGRFGSRFFSGTSPSASPNPNSTINKGNISSPIPTEEYAEVPAVEVPPDATASPPPIDAAAPVKRDVRAAPTPPPQKPTQMPVSAAGKIGTPDLAGYLRKKAERYNIWKDRYLILKDRFLYILKSPTDEKLVAWIDLAGYRFISDGTVGGTFSEKARYGFKAVHEKKPTHYFGSSDSVTIRNWMKTLMKATIGRDYSAPVTSSAKIKTISLAVAQAMNPPPRPPSPTSAARVQKASLNGNPMTLTAQDAAKLMGASVVPSAGNGSFSPTASSTGTTPKRKSGSMFLPPLRTSGRKKTSEGLSPAGKSGGAFSPPSEQGSPQYAQNRDSQIIDQYARDESFDYSPHTATEDVSQNRYTETTPIASHRDQEVLDWLNDHLPMGSAKALEWSDMASGRIFVRVVEHLSGKSSRIQPAAFDKYRPTQPGRAPDMTYTDTLFSCFDFLLDRGVEITDVSVNDLLTGHQGHMVRLGESIRRRFES